MHLTECSATRADGFEPPFDNRGLRHSRIKGLVRDGGKHGQIHFWQILPIDYRIAVGAFEENIDISNVEQSEKKST